jgi:hypothetical protein
MGNLLAEEGTEQLVSACRAATGESLRSVTFFTHNDYEQVYLRSDLERDADLSSFIGTELHEFENIEGMFRATELGEYQYTFRGFENGYLLRVTTENKGVFITTDGLTLQDYESVATSLKSLLREWEASEVTGN